MPGRLIRLVENLPRPRILVIGDLMLDRYVWGSVERISPEAPIQILNSEHEEVRPGGAANVARNLAALGARVTAVGVVGDDTAGAQLIRLLREAGADVKGIIKTPNRPTPVKTRMIAQSQQVLRVDYETIERIVPALQKRLERAIRRVADSCDAAVVVDYHKGTLPPPVAGTAIREFRRRRKPVIIGMKTPEVTKYRRATAVMLNRQELEQFSGVEGVEPAARSLLDRLSLRFLVATLGERGLMVVDNDGGVLRMSTLARAVYDVTGAGDSCLAAFTLAYTADHALKDCAAVANAAAALVVGKVGTAEVRRDELVRTLMREDVHAQHKILDTKELSTVLRAERARGRQIVFTNGCFDVLHPGHISLLQFAKSQGDLLVVGLNSDASVRVLKRSGRPIFEHQDRARILAALEAVDYVTVFDEETPADLIRIVRPNVLVKGEDWKGKTIVGASLVRKAGGRVALAPTLKGYSTTNVVRRISETSSQ